MTQKNFICPVCGFDKLNEPPISQANAPSYEICPCCGFEFGFDNKASHHTFDTFRKNWIENGAEWFIQNSKPKNWNLEEQLKNIGKKTIL